MFEGMGKGEYAEGGFGVEASAGLGISNKWDKGGGSVNAVNTPISRSTRYTSNQGSKDYHTEKA